jgi:hypothetical protein
MLGIVAIVTMVFIGIGVLNGSIHIAGFWMSMGMILMICIAALIEKKRIFSTVTFSNEGVEWRLFKKQVLFIKWEEIADVKQTHYGMIHQVALFRGQEKIEMEVLRKMYNTIMTICPMPDVKIKINELPCLKFFHKK